MLSPRYSFDDHHIGHASEGNTHLINRLIPRPRGLTAADWYNHARDVCHLLNHESGKSQ